MRSFVYDAIRTARTKAKDSGGLHGKKPVALAGDLLCTLQARLDFDAALVEDVLLGCVTAVGDQGSNVAKVAALYAGWPESVSGATINRFCASGLDAIIRAAEDVHCGNGELVCAGGVEMMSRVPMFGDKGPWFSDPEVARKTGFVHMGVAADFIANREQISRSQLDQYAARSHQRASQAQGKDRFVSLVTTSVDERQVERDELVRPGTTASKNGELPALFAGDSFEPARRLFASRYDIDEIEARHSLASSPAAADGASIALIGSESAQASISRDPRARIAGSAVVGTDPVEMLRGNIPAARRALKRAGLVASDIDVFEVNESFAVVPIDFAHTLGVDPDRVNINGGALSLGHPLGATGGCLLSMCIDELERSGGRYGMIAICGGAGVAAAVVLEALTS